MFLARFVIGPSLFIPFHYHVGQVHELVDRANADNPRDRLPLVRLKVGAPCCSMCSSPQASSCNVCVCVCVCVLERKRYVHVHVHVRTSTNCCRVNAAFTEAKDTDE